MTTTLKPWYAVAIPHEDIREGRLSEAVFAANLWAVVQRDAPEVYLDPDAFFAKTHLTVGLTNVLRRAATALSGETDAGDRILSLQTSFGGGKTHSLVALWHLAKHTETLRTSPACADLRRVLGNHLPERVKAVAVFTNRTCDATQGRLTSEGVRTRTLWGELALQLGGVELYREIEANDQARTVPQGLLAEILRRATPCLILLDEIADYCVGAAAVPVGDTTLADQTISFAQELTDAVSRVPGVAVIATLPASHLEVAGSEKGQEILTGLEKRFGRMSADIRPVADDEIYEVVRRRLFETVGAADEHGRVADAYLRMYGQHRNEVPAEATRGTFRERLVSAYPFHPALIDALYLRWGSHGDFQRTRGVLRLLASIVGDLWNRRNTETQSQPLIQPCHVRWTVDALHANLTRLWGAAYDSVIAADVIGGKANAAQLDEERGGEYNTEKIAQGLAAAIVLGSFGGQGERAGYGTRDLKLCVSRPDLNWGYTDGALLALEERAFYLHSTSLGDHGKRYWFGTRPTLTKLIVQYRNQFAAQSFDAEIIEALQAQVKALRTSSATWHVIVNPQADLPEQKGLTLLVMPPDCAYAENGGQVSFGASATADRLLELSRRCGSRDRLYRNTLLLLLPSPRGLTKLRTALREVAALESAQRDYGSQLDSEQTSELARRLTKSRSDVAEALCLAYSYMARVEDQSLSAVALATIGANFSDHLQAAWKQVVEDEEWVLRKVGQVTLQQVGLIPDSGGIRVKDAIETFLRYTDKPMIAGRDAVLEGLSQACKERRVSIGRGINFKDLQRQWCGESVTLDPNEDGLWVLPPCEPKMPTGQADATTAPRTLTDLPSEVSEADKGSETAQTREGAATVDVAKPARQTRRITIAGEVPLDSWSDVFRSFVSPAARMGLKKLRLGIDFELVTQDDQPLDENSPALKAMKEAARQLGLKLADES